MYNQLTKSEIESLNYGDIIYIEYGDKSGYFEADDYCAFGLIANSGCDTHILFDYESFPTLWRAYSLTDKFIDTVKEYHNKIGFSILFTAEHFHMDKDICSKIIYGNNAP